MREAIDAVERSFDALARGTAVNMPRQRTGLAGVSLNVLGAVSSELDTAVVKSYPIVRRDVTVGSSFTVLVYQVSDGALLGMLEGNALGQIRTGAASAVATRYLARADSRSLTLFGAGWQAESQLEGLICVMPRLERVMVVGRAAQKVERFCARMTERLGLAVEPAVDAERAVREADVLTTATGSGTPLFDGEWLTPGVHVNAVGSNYAEKQELDAATVRRSHCVVVDDLATARAESGDLLAAEARGQFDWSTAIPLCEIVAGGVAGRASPDDITLFESQGLGLEDLAVATHALKRARERGVGLEIPVS